MQLYFGKAVGNGQLVLNGDEAHHCKNVMRMRPGDPLSVTDGRGNVWDAILVSFTKEEALADITHQTTKPKRDTQLHVAISPTKNIERFQWFMEKATELGIDDITPLITARTERKNLNVERLNKVLISAMKQSLQAWLPTLHPAVGISGFLERGYVQSVRVICHAHNAQPLSSVIKDGQSIVALIGPEGDFTDEELKAAISKGYSAATLGKNRLRTETAGVAFCAWMAMRL